MKRLALILFLTLHAIPFAWGAGNPVDDLFDKAQAALNARGFDDALHLYEQILTGHPEAVDRWFDAQILIAGTLAKKGDLAEAAKAAHLCLDGAPNPQAYFRAVSFAASVLSALDKDVSRANQFLAFQQSGPAGGAANPMDAIGYPSLPERDQAFATMRQKAGDTATASRLRAFTFLFTGKPREALAQFADAFRRNSHPQGFYTAGGYVRGFQESCLDLVVVGLRAVRGHAAGLDASLQFVIYGPDGPDGIPRTADDIADPFAQYLPATPAPGEGGLTGLSADDLQVLRKVRDAARLYAEDSFIPTDVRIPAFAALCRSNDALDDWGAPGQTDCYLRLFKQVLEAQKASGFQVDQFPYLVLEGKLLESAQVSAKSRALHLGGIHGLWKALDAYCAAQGIKSTQAMKNARIQFESLCTALNNTIFPKTIPAPLKAPAVF